MENVGTWENAFDGDGFTERLLGPNAQSPAVFALRVLSGSSLACVFGLACALDELGHASVVHVVAFAAPTVVFGLGFVPALWVLLTLFGRTVDVGRLAAAATRTSAVVGIVLGGLAPSAALFELTAGGGDGRLLATALELVAAFVAGLLGARTFRHEALESVPMGQREGMASVLVSGFALLGLLLGARFIVPALLTFGF